MIELIDVNEKERKLFDSLATHPLQSYAWGQFRKATHISVVRKILLDDKKPTASIQLTIHRIPHTPWNIGYFPKGTIPTKDIITALQKIGKENNCIFIQLEPNSIFTQNDAKKMKEIALRPAAHPLFTQYTFQLDLTQSEEMLLKHMHPKTRYNIKIAQKHHVEITKEDTNEGFDTYWQLMDETTRRQGFYAHTKKYHEKMWETLSSQKDGLQGHLFIGRYQPENQKHTIPLVAWILFTFHNALYYPYGASSSQYRNVMASNLMMWEAIKFGKEKNLKVFDMWGSLGETPNEKDPWYGFHRLKMGYGPTLVKFLGSYDLVLNPLLYNAYVWADKIRWILLRLR